jgi:hypothetical protein
MTTPWTLTSHCRITLSEEEEMTYGYLVFGTASGFLTGLLMGWLFRDKARAEIHNLLTEATRVNASLEGSLRAVRAELSTISAARVREQEAARRRVAQADSRVASLYRHLQLMAERIATIRGASEGGPSEPPSYIPVDDQFVDDEPFSRELADFLARIESEEVRNHLEGYVHERRRLSIPDDEILEDIRSGKV